MSRRTVIFSSLFHFRRAKCRKTHFYQHAQKNGKSSMFSKVTIRTSHFYLTIIHMIISKPRVNKQLQSYSIWQFSTLISELGMWYIKMTALAYSTWESYFQAPKSSKIFFSSTLFLGKFFLLDSEGWKSGGALEMSRKPRNVPAWLFSGTFRGMVSNYSSPVLFIEG